MRNTKFTGLLTRRKAVRYLIYLLLVCVFAVFVIKLNQVEKTELVVRTGQTFEKAKVVKILQDNLEENGTRVGEQKVRVRMLTGVKTSPRQPFIPCFPPIRQRTKRYIRAKI